VGSRVQWTLLLRDSDGKVTTEMKEANETFAKATATVVIPPEQMSRDREYYLAIYKRIPSEFDKAFYNCIEEGKGLPLWRGRVVEGQCEVRAEWPVRDPDLLFVLLERIPNLPVDATPMMVRTRSIATLRRVSTITQTEIIRFVPDGK